MEERRSIREAYFGLIEIGPVMAWHVSVHDTAEQSSLFRVPTAPACQTITTLLSLQ